MRPIAACIILLIAFASPAAAQTPTPAAPAFYTKTEAGQWIVRLRKGGIAVRDPKSDVVGYVRGMLMNKDGSVHAYLVHHDTYLTFGGRYAAISAGSFTRMLDQHNYVDYFNLPLTAKALEKAPVFSDKNK